MTRITPFLWFHDNAMEAAEFYVSVFDRAEIGSVAPGPNGTVMVVELTIDGQSLSIMNGGPHFTLSEAFSFVIHCQDQDEVDRYWTALTADGGEESMCGWLKDKFGVSWQVTPSRLQELMSDPDPERAGRAVQAMMGMRKINIAELEAAADAVAVATA